MSLVDTGSENFDFIVQKPPTTVGIGSYFFPVLTFLTAYQTSASQTFTIEVEFTCPSAPLLLTTPPLNGLSFSYDLSVGGLDTFDASLVTIYPAGCGWAL